MVHCLIFFNHCEYHISISIHIMKRNKIKINFSYEGMKIDESSLLNVEFKDYIRKIVDEKYDTTS